MPPGSGVADFVGELLDQATAAFEGSGVDFEVVLRPARFVALQTLGGPATARCTWDWRAVLEYDDGQRKRTVATGVKTTRGRFA